MEHSDQGVAMTAGYGPPGGGGYPPPGGGYGGPPPGGGFGGPPPGGYGPPPGGFGGAPPGGYNPYGPPGAGGPGFPGPGGPNMGDGNVNTTLPMVLGVVSVLCCCLPLGAATIIFTTQAKEAIRRGDYATAQSKARTATILGFVSIGCGAIAWVFWLVAQGMR